ncbi:unnamed protein product [Vicia faba]|uniref:Uncharacterized protein n=1 Tax=Vicia faba TaxID=3906 RepID=A0AAV1A879_VICFA|nr:unnamed protein product [Vicia faba]
MVPITLPNLLVRIFEMIFEITVQHAMGLMSFIVVASGDLGISVTKEQLTALNMFPVLKNSRTTSVTPLPTRDQTDLKKKELYPSIPGAFVFPMLVSASKISFSVTGQIRERACSLDNVLPFLTTSISISFNSVALDPTSFV